MKKKKLRGKTPWNTVNAVLCKNSKFKHVGEEKSGTYGLSELFDGIQ